MLLIASLCRAWGALETGPGLLVWADLPRRAAPPAPRDLSRSGDRSRSTTAASYCLAADSDDASRSPAENTEARSDLGWSAKKTPAESRGTGAEASWGAEAGWV
ncbi:hypothetical protein SAV31267_027660 [Streptomyces avermitilis]|uniref:Uncharacterized protein n=1 Tax=Streptomyces avermitilis TaxID=33903 RepID=A0A4D4MME9_STRAX|nr:hypothetical protein SAV31267_027660 [Streptomyces avermitilis]